MISIGVFIYLLTQIGDSLLFDIWVPCHFVLYCWVLYPTFKTCNDMTKINDVGMSKGYIIFTLVLSLVHYVVCFIGIFLFQNNTTKAEEILFYFYISIFASFGFLILASFLHGCFKSCGDDCCISEYERERNNQIAHAIIDLVKLRARQQYEQRSMRSNNPPPYESNV